MATHTIQVPAAKSATAAKVLVSWSGGKDSALALAAIRRSGEYEPAALLTTVTEGYDRISMHGVRRVLLERQAEALGLPLEVVAIPPACINDTYEARMRAAIGQQVARGIRGVVFGDIFLQDIRRYREEKLAQADLRPLFPLWGRNTSELLAEFIAAGFRAVIVCLDPRKLDASFAGCELDEQFLRRLPDGVDPCGENGEFHTFVYEGPILRRAVPFAKGEVVTRDGFVFCDLLPG
jgi:uncharacterized protein (TIGR00290 family)